ncbi:MAG: type 1 glutamine amidotransferase [Pseudomonadota bacterium]
MRIGILVTGHALDELLHTRGDYDKIFDDLLTAFGFETKAWFVVDEEYPMSPEDADGWLITGSKHGAYEDHPWIAPLEEFIRAVYADGRPMIGICFGHQIIAQALGGKVVKFEKGWAVGHTDYEIEGDQMRLLAWHQDQVVEKPETAKVIGSNAFCENAALLYDNRILTIQPHPEFDGEILEKLIAVRGKGVVEPDRLKAAQDTQDMPHDSLRFVERMSAFFRQGAAHV